MSRGLAAAALGLALALWASAAPGAGRQLWIWMNNTTAPATIGVGTGSLDLPGWRRMAGPFPTCKHAWSHAMTLHKSRVFHSPHLARGDGVCGSWRPAGPRRRG